MTRRRFAYTLALLLSARVGAEEHADRRLRLSTAEGLEARGVKIEGARYRGLDAVRLTELPGARGETIAIVRGLEFRDGTLEVKLAGVPRPDADDQARGFVGLAFHVQPRADRLECLYLRPTNGRAEDQLRRNHSAQYASHPDFPWDRLRRESPGLYESYVDLEAGAWTIVKVVVSGTKARLYVHGAEQPCLIVNDLKLGNVGGAVALWIGEGTEAYFADLRVTPASP